MDVESHWQALLALLGAAFVALAIVSAPFFRAASRLVATAVRNRLALMRIRHVRSDLRRYLSSRGLKPKTIVAFLGLADPSELRTYVIFDSDSTLEVVKGSAIESDLRALWATALAASQYPAKVSGSSLSFHSHEEILREGGYRNYFN
jgi:hypothetical protein